MDYKNLMTQCLIEANDIICEVDDYLEKKIEQAYEDDDREAVDVAYESRDVLQNQIGEIAGRLFDAARSRERKDGIGFGALLLDNDKQRCLCRKLLNTLAWFNRSGTYSPDAEDEFEHLANDLIDALEEIVGVRGGKKDGR